MDVFNPKILDASIRDVASCLSDTQKVDLLLYALAAIPLPPLPNPNPHPNTSPSSSSSSSAPPGYTQTGAGARTSASASASVSPSTSYTSIGYGLSYIYNSSAAGYSGYAPASPAHTLLENGIASALQVRALPPPTVARARVLRARARMRMRVGVGGGYGTGNERGTEGGEGEWEWVKGVRDDLHAALEADPTNKEARALLATLDGESHARSQPHTQVQAETGREQHDDERDRGQEDDRRMGERDEEGAETDMDVNMDLGREKEVEPPVQVQVQASRGPTGAEKILSPMASPTLMHPPKEQASSSRLSGSTSTAASVVASGSASGGRTSTSFRPPTLYVSSSYSSSSAHASTSTSASSAMPPPASPTPKPARAHAPPPAPTFPSSSYRTHAPAVHIPPTRLSAEVWRLVGTHLSRRDLANVLYLRHPLALVAAERLAADVEVWFGSGGPATTGEWDGVELARRRARGEKGRVAEDGFGDYSDRDRDAEYDDVDMERDRDDERARGAKRRRDNRGSFEDVDEEEDRKDDARRAMRTAHLLARVIRDPVFASRVRTLRVYFGPVESNARPGAHSSSSRSSGRARGRGSKAEDASPGVAFQTGMLSNALPSLLHLRNVHISGGAVAMLPVLRILQRRAPKLMGLSLTSPDSPPDLSFLDLHRLVHFSYTITGPNGANTAPASSSALQRVLAGAQGTLKSVALLNSYAAVGYLQPQPAQSASSTNNSTAYSYSSPSPTATAAASASYAGPIGHQQLLHPQPPAPSNTNGSTASSNSGTGYSRHGQSQQHGQYPQYPLAHPYAPSPHQHALPSHARSLAPHPHSAHAHSAQTHASAMMSVHALAGGSGGSSSGHVGPASSGGAGGMIPQQQPQPQRDQQGYRPRIAPAPPAGYTSSAVPSSLHGGGGPPQQAPVPAPTPVPLWVFPTGALSIGNLTRIHFAGAIPAGSRVFADILAYGRHLETLDIECAPLECTDAAQQFLDAASGSSGSSFRSSSSSDGSALPMLTNFSFTVSSLSRRYADNSGSGAGTALFPAIAELLRGRRTLRTLALVVAPQASASVEAQMHTAVGFDASVWGVLPSLQGALRGVRMTYPADLAAGLAGWLVPRSVRALGIVMGESGPLKSGGADGSWTPGSERERKSPSNRDWDRESDRDVRGEKQRATREALQFLNALKSSMPPGLRFISLPDSLLSILPPPDRDSSSSVSSSTAAATLVVEHGFPSVRVVRMGTSYWTVSRKALHASAPGYSSSSSSYSVRDPSAPPSYESHMYDDRNPPSGANSRGDKEVLELEKWPRHRALYHTLEFLAWYGCEDAVIRDVTSFSA